MKFSELPLLKVGDTIQMVGAIYEGEGDTFLCFFPGEFESGTTRLQRLEMSLEEWQTFIRQTDLLETEVLTKAADGTLAKAILRKSQRQIDQNVSWRVFRRDEYRCRYCYRDDAPLTVDHLVRWEEGGPSIEANLLSSCKKCNKVRGDTSYEDWLSHPYYRKVSGNLPEKISKSNEAILPTLDAIPRVVHVKSR